ncbi:MAG: hypothetical protein GYA20_08270 [Chloroflexi bacterium]|nr:hypothetical protein [Chloroflexota bacterium]
MPYDSAPLDPMEEHLQSFFHHPQPSAAFQARLESTLQAEALAARRRPPARGRAWGIATAAVLALAAGVLLAGPQRVLAMLQALSGYIPGAGSVALEETYVLPQPVARTQAGITLTVEQVVATADQTLVTVALSQLPEGQAANWQRSRLRLPDGTEWYAARAPGSFFTDPAENLSRARFEFPALPADTRGLTFIWTQFGGEYQNEPLAEWTIALTLQLVGDTHLAAQYGSGYPVQENAATVAAVTLEVLEVINLPQSSLAHVRWLYPAEHWDWQLFPEPAGAYLEDENGRRYPALTQQDALVETSRESTVNCPGGSECYSNSGYIAFERIPDGAARLTLHVPEFNLTWEPALQFDLDLGTAPAEGDVFPLDVELSLPVEDETLPLIGAQIQRLTDLPDAPLGLSIQPGEPAAGGMLQVETLWFESEGKVNTPWTVRWDGNRVPTGILPITAGGAQGRLRGPWVLPVVLQAASQP